jgi:HD superfamily phosphohydrolase
MNDERLEFYDPLFETVTFEKGLPTDRSGFRRDHRDDALDPRDIVQTPEFARLAFLRQGGVAWLVFPSATHTRFAHSIGCWRLGRIAETLVKVSDGPYAKSLHRWLGEEKGLREEYYLALLLHNIGRGPFSHVFERNRAFLDGLREAGLAKPDYEHRGTAILEGTEQLRSTWKLHVGLERLSEDTRPWLADVVSTLKTCSEGAVCMSAVYYLMTGDEEFLIACPHDHKDAVRIVKDLVRGLIDLGRLDEFARDAYFSGIRQGTINLRGFLNNVRIHPIEGGRQHGTFFLTEEGAAHVASLLFSRRQIVSILFRNPRLVSLDAMVNCALTAYLESAGEERGKAAMRFSCMGDEEFLQFLSTCEHSGCRGVAQRILRMNPYVFVGRWPASRFDTDGLVPSSTFDEYARAPGTEVPAVILHYDDGFRGEIESGRGWLDTDRLFLEQSGSSTNDVVLTNHASHQADFAHLRETAWEHGVWVFVSDPSMKGRVKGDLIRLAGPPNG